MLSVRAFIRSRTAWLLLAATAASLELTALFFQHGMHLDPCVMCVYERVAVVGLVIAGLVGALFPGLALLRGAGYLLWGISAGWGLKLVSQHVAVEHGASDAITCTFSPEFPTWFRLDEWFPQVFLPTGYCDDVQWRWLGLSMAEWMVWIFAAYLVVLLAVVTMDVVSARRAP